MSKSSVALLPKGWFWSDHDDQKHLSAEYALELPPIHPLAGIQVEVVAHRTGNDDILVRCLGIPDQVAVVHLSWLGREETDNHPAVEYIGPFTGFVAWELETYGVGIGVADGP
jgi:hypothetical protein